MDRADDVPYCVNCNYELTGLTESSKCPECGKPIVEVLVRASFLGRGRRYTSKRKLFGLPLVAIAFGPRGTQRYGAPVGFVAIGDQPRGVIAFGGAPVGVIAVGGIPRGVIAIGGLSFGVLSFGGIGVGVLAVGGLTLGLWAVGGLALVVIRGWGTTINIWPF